MTDPQLSLTFDLPEAKRQAELGMDRASRAERVAIWKANAEGWIHSLPTGYLFTADDLVRAIGLPEPGAEKNNVVGAIFSAQAKRGVIYFCGTFRRSQRVIGHGNLQRIWEKR